ncbi:MAG: fluoride efflux transporter CrcB [Sedimentisphaerales bacterium]|nr:fluoride efflux transporter CrcB [Sedimentisphaerales bacterium]
MLKFLFIAAGGAIGAIFRYSLSGWIQSVVPGSLPWGTLCVNTAGSLLMGIFWGLSELTPISPAVRLFFAIGFLGSFTTFSTFSVETFGLLRDRETVLGLMNIGLNNVLALVFVFGGYFLSRSLLNVFK